MTLALEKLELDTAPTSDCRAVAAMARRLAEALEGVRSANEADLTVARALAWTLADLLETLDR